MSNEDGTISTDHSPASDLPDNCKPGGSWELWTLAFPLMLSTSFMTIQMFVDRAVLSRYDTDAMGASLHSSLIYWFLFAFLFGTCSYVATFVAQYTGANRPHRVGPAVWQGIYFGVVAGLVFMIVIPFAPIVVSWGNHSAVMQKLEITYLQTLCVAGLPGAIVAAISGFFAGRGRSWTVLLINVVGTIVNVLLDLVLINGWGPFPEWGIAGAGLATAAGAGASAVAALLLFFSGPNRRAFNTLRGCWPERELFGRLLKYGMPAGIQMSLDCLAFACFVMLVGRLGNAELNATGLAVTINMLAFLPMMGMGQAISILVGQRLGEEKPEIAERSTWTGMYWAILMMAIVAVIYVTMPETLMWMFENDAEPESFALMASLVPTLLICCAIFTMFDSVNLTFSFALRGAGDTRFVTVLTFSLAWPIMVIPTYFVVEAKGSLYYAWAFATAYIIAMAICFFFRFRSGVWKSMRVIESVENEPKASATDNSNEPKASATDNSNEPKASAPDHANESAPDNIVRV